MRTGILVLLCAGLQLGHVLPSDPVGATPSAQLLRWGESELGVIIHFNMETMMADQPNPQQFCITVGGIRGTPLPGVDQFAPELLNVSQWVKAASDFGAKYAVMVAQHCSGFALWPTDISAETGFNYTYSVKHTAWGGGHRDVMQEFVDACKQYGLFPGVYYSLNHNYYLNVASSKVNGTAQPLVPGQAVVSQELYESIARAQMRELYSKYGEYFECWFDGGMGVPGTEELVLSLQPNAMYQNGVVKDGNNVRWIGTESGTPSYPVWSTNAAFLPNQTFGTPGAGVAGGPVWDPAEEDATMQVADQWFWKPGDKVHSLEELKGFYHANVGANVNLLLDVAPDNTGLVPADATAQYEAFGRWWRSCYDAGTTAAAVNVSTNAVVLQPQGTFDRLLIQEDQTDGQRIRAYEVDAGGVLIANGTSVGNKRIQVLPQPMRATDVTLRLTSVAGDGPVTIKKFALIDGAANGC